MNAGLLRALDLGLAGDWTDATAALRELDDPISVRLLKLIAECERNDARQRSTASFRHEIGNALTIIQANLEGIIDGVLEPTTERLTGMRNALVSAGATLEKLR